MVVDFGWATLSDRKPWEAHIANGRPEEGPHVTPDLLEQRLKVKQWSRQPDQTAWHDSPFFNEYVKTCHLDDGLFGHFLLEPGRMRWTSVYRAFGDRPFDDARCQADEDS